jgi:hypothetical protein
VILLPVLLVLTGCQSLHPVAEDKAYNTVMVNLLTGLNTDLVLPEVMWIYHDGMYCLSEEDADRILDFKENTLPQFLWELEQYKKEINIVFDALTEK